MSEIRSWLLPLDQPEGEIARFAALLTGDERARAAAFRYDLQRHRFIARRAQLRILLADLTGGQPEAIRFCYTAHGKPHLRGDRDLNFSVSSAGALGLCVVAREIEVGCDIAVDEETPSTLEIARLLFAPEEYRALANLPATAHSRFLTVWTRKEAYLKAIGTGLQRDLRTFSVLGDDETITLREAGRSWQLTALDVGGGFVASVAAAILDRRPSLLAATTLSA